ncbi:MAG TPA: UDP-N-acetylglucosamine--N-acetylmuramyl-(pentapeptide) pyrophosphoryl-undecaprenol N-acetylglucosamine transferase, partial [Methylocystis sp.]
NAAVLQATGAAEVVRQENFTPRFLSERLAVFIDDPASLKLPAECAKAAGVADAAQRLADLALGVAKAKTQDMET